MRRTLPPPPIPDAPSSAGFLDGVIGLLAQAITYPFRRPFQNFPRSLWKLILWWPFGVGISIYLLEYALFSLAYARRQPDQPPPAPIGWVHQLQPWYVVTGLGVGLALIVFLDRQASSWPVRVSRERPFLHWGQRAVAKPVPDLPAQLWTLGPQYERIWNVETSHFDEIRLDTIYGVSPDELATHALIVAPTGMGKTFSLILPSLEYLDRIEAAGIYLDAKGDDLSGPEFEAAYPQAFHYRFDLEHPDPKPWFQLWAGPTPRVMAERLGEALIPAATTSEGEYFHENQRSTLVGLVDAHYAVYGQMPTLPDLLRYLRNGDQRRKLVQRLPNDSWEKEAVLRIEELRLGKADALGGLDAKLEPLAHPTIARLFARPGEGFNMDDILRDAARVCFTLPVGRAPYVAKILGKLLVSQYTYAVLDPTVNKGLLKVLVVDEAHNFITPDIARGLAQGRSHRAAYVLVFQDLSQLGDESLIREIISNAGLKIVMGGVSDADARRFSNLFGDVDVPFHNYTASSSQGTGDMHSSGHTAAQSIGHSGRSRTRQSTTGWSMTIKPRALFTASEIRGLRPHHGIVERRDSQGHLTRATLVQFDRVLADAITQQQRIARFGPHVEASHVVPNLTLFRQALPAPIRPAPSVTTPGAPANSPAPRPRVEQERVAARRRASTKSTSTVVPSHRTRLVARLIALSVKGPGDSSQDLGSEPAQVVTSSSTPDLMPDTSDLSTKQAATPPAEETAAPVRSNAPPSSLADDPITNQPGSDHAVEIDPVPATSAETPAVDDAASNASEEQARSEVEEQVRINMEQILAATQLDIEAETARRLATTAAGNGRDVFYIPAVIQAILKDTKLRSRGAAFIQRINSNWDLPSPT